MTDTESMKTGELIDEVKARLAQKNSAFEGLLGRLEELRSERYDLICKRDRWQTRAESAEARVEELALQRDRQSVRLNEAKAERDNFQIEKHRLNSRVEELTTENARLEQELVSAEMGKSPAEQEIKILRVEKERLEREVAEVTEGSKIAASNASVTHGERRAYEDRVRWLEGQLKVRDDNIAHQKTRIRELTEERDDLRAENERLAEDRDEALDRVDHLHGALRDIRPTAVPRVIRPDEVREGQVVWAVWENEHGGFADKGRVLNVDRDYRLVDIESAGGRIELDDSMFVLLSDAPEDADEDERRGEVIDVSEVRVGDVVDVWTPKGDLAVSGEHVDVDRHVSGAMPGDELRLVSRPADSDDFPCCRINQTGICEDVG